jgi:phosphoribosylaminoimidazolecarboxamide formyltransferase/IMP cyclohydrolase
VATAVSLVDAYDRAYRTDPTSAFGGIIAFNRELDEETAVAIVARQFVEVIAHRRSRRRAAAVLAGRQNVRVLAVGALSNRSTPNWNTAACRWPARAESRYRARRSGNLHGRDPEEAHAHAVRGPWFAWRVCKYVKSNAIVFAREGMTIGVGAGQMSRVYSTRIAALKAKDEGLDVEGSVMASDAFFPFRDGIDVAAEYGIKAIVQPGGSSATMKSSPRPTSTA